MTPAELDEIIAQVDRLKKIVQTLRAFDHCRTETDFTCATRDLKTALDSMPKKPVDKLGG